MTVRLSFLLAIVLIPLLYIMSVFMSHSIGLAYYSYDNWRIEQIMIMFVSIIAYGLFFSDDYLLKIPNRAKLLLGSTLLLMGISAYRAHSSLFAIIELSLMATICIYLFVLSRVWCTVNAHMQASKIAHHVLALVALSPMYVGFWFVFGHYLYFANDVTLAWYGAFLNIRYYDDLVLPCLFLLWFAPGFLRGKTFIVVACSSLYLLTLWVDGARAVLLSLLVGLSTMCFFYQERRKVLLVPVASILISLVLYQLMTLWVLPEASTGKADYTITRMDSSGRAPMWLSTLDAWLSEPILGVGGGNFLFAEKIVNPQHLSHVHNIVIQTILEWGIAGIAFVMAVVYGFWRYVVRANDNIPPQFFAGAIALVLNMCLGGAGVYPHTQLATTVFFAYLLSFYFAGQAIGAPHNERLALGKLFLNWLVVSVLMCPLVIYALTQYRANEMEVENGYGPRFWQQTIIQ